ACNFVAGARSENVHSDGDESANVQPCAPQVFIVGRTGTGCLGGLAQCSKALLRTTAASAALSRAITGRLYDTEPVQVDGRVSGSHSIDLSGGRMSRSLLIIS